MDIQRVHFSGTLQDISSGGTQAPRVKVVVPPDLTSPALYAQEVTAGKITGTRGNGNTNGVSAYFDGDPSRVSSLAASVKSAQY